MDTALTAASIQSTDARDVLRALRSRYLDRTQHLDHEMALPLSACCWLWGLLRRREPKTILDVGSGLSSLVFRCWGGATVVSTDHDEDFLDMVRYIIDLEGLPRGYLVLHPLRVQRHFDLVFVDHGPSMNHRLRDLPDLSERVSPGGMLVLDDFHDPPGNRRARYQFEATRLLRDLNWVVRSIPSCRLASATRRGG